MALSTWGCGRGGPGRPTITVSAAADLAFAFQEVARAFEGETGVRVQLNLGSSGVLAQQIRQGAPVDVFASANLDYVRELEGEGLLLPDTVVVYARGRLALWSREDAPVEVRSLGDLLRPEVRRVAIANPNHAPYGAAARQALQRAGLWGPLQPKLVIGENVRQALQYARGGDADAALVALSLALQAGGRWAPVPQGLYQPLDQAMAVVRGTPHEAEARAFVRFVTGPRGRAILQGHGFTIPQGGAP